MLSFNCPSAKIHLVHQQTDQNLRHRGHLVYISGNRSSGFMAIALASFIYFIVQKLPHLSQLSKRKNRRFCRMIYSCCSKPPVDRSVLYSMFFQFFYLYHLAILDNNGNAAILHALYHFIHCFQRGIFMTRFVFCLFHMHSPALMSQEINRQTMV